MKIAGHNNRCLTRSGRRKIRHFTRADADRQAARDTVRNRCPCIAYYCSDCGFWHTARDWPDLSKK